MASSYSSKLKPATASSYQSKLKPLAAPPASQPQPQKLGQGPLGDFSGGVVRAVSEPLMRLGGLIQKTLTGGKAGQGAMDAATASEQSPTSTAGAVGRVAGEVLPYFTPVGVEGLAAKTTARVAPTLTKLVGSKVSPIISKGVGFLTGRAPQVATDAAIGTAQTGSPEQGAITAASGQLARGAGSLLKSGAKAVYEAASVPLSKMEARILQAYKANKPFVERISSALTDTSTAPSTAANTAFRKGFWGTESMMGTQARKAQSGLWDHVISPALKRNTTPVNMQAFFTDAEAAINKNSKELGDRSARLNALRSIKEEYQAKPSATLEELQGFKEGWASHVPKKHYRGEDISENYNNVRAELADLARQRIYKELGPEVRQAYLDYGNLKGISEWGQTAMTGSRFKGGAGSFLSAMKDMVLTPISTVGGHVLYKLGNGLRFVGAPGARYLSDLFNEESPPSR